MLQNSYNIILSEVKPTFQIRHTAHQCFTKICFSGAFSEYPPILGVFLRRIKKIDQSGDPSVSPQFLHQREQFANCYPVLFQHPYNWFKSTA